MPTKDSLLAHCIARAVLEEQGGLDAAKAKYGARMERLSTWEALRTTAKATPKAMRVATFVVSWAIGMQQEKAESFSITEYQRYWKESERQAYRVQKEFRDLFPEFETPNELARQIVSQVNARLSKRQAAKLPLAVEVVV